MQHGVLTPLGRQLRAVLANLSSPARTPPIPHTTTANLDRTSQSDRPQNGRRTFSRAPAPQSQAIAAAIEHAEPQTSPPNQPNAPFRTHSQRRLKRRRPPANDYLTQALNDTANRSAAPKARPSKINLSFVDAKSKRIWKDYDERQQRFANTPLPRRLRPRALSLQRITSAFIRNRAALNDLLNPDREIAISLAPQEEDYLRRTSYTLEDVAVWAEIISSKDSFAAAKLLSDRIESLGPQAIPVWVLLYFLRRQYVSARALRLLLSSTESIVEYRTERLPNASSFTNVIFIAAMRLIRHAREVWPQVLKIPVNIMLRHIQQLEHRTGPFTISTLSNVTYLLNKLMQLVSLSTALHPYRDNLHQETALVPILQYMAGRDPPLHINRQGYRAVVRVQLLQRKTASEQQWAELKALSWPPWKVDRTAMDSALGPEHGISKAGATLARMREAGYRPLYWEKLATLFTGWDVDQTPTIQMRALLNPPGMHFSNKLQGFNDPWVARIQSTRTVQEAWACYLAWEDQKLPPDQDVYLATFTKLYEAEQEARARAAKGMIRLESLDLGHWPLLPGDMREISPLPPSTHLETYTRTVPPKVYDFYILLRHRHVELQDRCVAFVTEHARRFDEGITPLRDACVKYPAIKSLISPSPRSEDLAKVPRAVFAAVIQLYVHCARVSLSKSLSGDKQPEYKLDRHLETLAGFRVNADSPVIHALRLLRLRPLPDGAIWNKIILKLQQPHMFIPFSNALEVDSHHMNGAGRARLTLAKEAERCKGAMNAFVLVRHVVDLQKEHKFDLDSIGFLALCQSTAHAAVAWWNVLLQLQNSDLRSATDLELRMLLQAAKMIGRDSKAHSDRLRREFGLLVGHEEAPMPGICQDRVDNAGETLQEDDASSPSTLPKLLTTPNPVILHGYIRALGWLADYEGTLATIRWMAIYHAELREQQDLERRGAEMMRKTIVATRVFLERSWIHDATRALDPDDVGQYKCGDEDEAVAILGRTESSADPGVIDAVREAVESVEEWGGWPSDEEVDVYTRDDRFTPSARWSGLTVDVPVGKGATVPYSPALGWGHEKAEVR